MKGFANPKTEFLMSNEDKLVSSIFDGWHQYQLNLIEHGLHHGSEISITLGSNGVPALNL
jgi:hypothetical protein